MTIMKLTAIAFMSAAVAAPALAESTARRTSGNTDGPVTVRADYDGNSCDYIAESKQGLPEGAAEEDNVVPVTFIVADRMGCSGGQAATLEHTATVYPLSSDASVQLYFVKQGGEVMKGEQLPIK